jgi:hypothetical protein
MALLCGVFVPMVDLVAEISQTALSNLKKELKKRILGGNKH